MSATSLSFLTNIYVLSSRPSFFELQAKESIQQSLVDALIHLSLYFSRMKMRRQANDNSRGTTGGGTVADSDSTNNLNFTSNSSFQLWLSHLKSTLNHLLWNYSITEPLFWRCFVLAIQGYFLHSHNCMWGDYFFGVRPQQDLTESVKENNNDKKNSKTTKENNNKKNSIKTNGKMSNLEILDKLRQRYNSQQQSNTNSNTGNRNYGLEVLNKKAKVVMFLVMVWESLVLPKWREMYLGWKEGRYNINDDSRSGGQQGNAVNSQQARSAQDSDSSDSEPGHGSPNRGNKSDDESPILILSDENLKQIRLKLLRFIARLYPYYHTSEVFLQTVYRVFYLFQAHNSWSCIHQYLGVEYQRQRPPSQPIQQNQQNMSQNQNQDPTQTQTDSQLATQQQQQLQPQRSLTDILKSILSNTTWGGLYMLQLLSWYYQQDETINGGANNNNTATTTRSNRFNRNNYRNINNNDLNPLPPLPHPKKDYHYKSPPGLFQNRNICNLCKKERKNPAQSRCGVVFCYGCLSMYVRRKGRCPISKWPMNREGIRRIHME